MNRLFVSLVGSSVLAASLGSVALADNSSISLTGPHSTNVITSSGNRVSGQGSGSCRTNFGRGVGLTTVSNWQQQRGDGDWDQDDWTREASTWHNNTNNDRDNDRDDNSRRMVLSDFDPGTNWMGNGTWNNSGSGMASIFLTGPGSTNVIGGGGGGSISLTGPGSTNQIGGLGNSGLNNPNQMPSWFGGSGRGMSMTSTNNNNVGISNVSDQNAESGSVTASGNTEVNGALTSGNASNSNDTTNNVSVTNSAPSFMGSGSGGSGNASISTTGPGSKNIIGQSGGHNRTNVTNNNNINVSNMSQQTATSGNVSAHGNTVVGGLSSGNAWNTNSTSNSVTVSN